MHTLWVWSLAIEMRDRIYSICSEEEGKEVKSMKSVNIIAKIIILVIKNNINNKK